MDLGVVPDVHGEFRMKEEEGDRGRVRVPLGEGAEFTGEGARLAGAACGLLDDQGRALVAAATATARSAGCGVLTVGTHPGNRRAQNFYPELGFKAASVQGPRFWIQL